MAEETAKESVEEIAEDATTEATGATTDDITKVDPDSLTLEEAQAKIKSLQADYTRKTQALSKERKELEEKGKKADETLNWYSKNEQGIYEFNKWKEEQSNAPETPVEELYTGAEDLDQIKALKADYEKKLLKVQDDYSQAMQQGYQQIKDLTEIKITDPDANWDKILETARANNIVDMRKAYNLTYEERLTQKKIDAAVKAREKEIEEKTKADVITTVAPLGRQVRNVIKPKQRR
jgi:hypothetical protein